MKLKALAAVVLLAPLAAGTAGTASAEPAPLTWTPCATQGTDPTVECASIEVPIDRANPALGTAKIALNRLPAKDKARRAGSLLTNPGGPGGSGTSSIAYADIGFSTPEFAEIRQRYDVIGFDPRGIWKSTPAIRCDRLYDPAVNRFPADRAGFDRLAAFNEAAGKNCLAKTGPLLANADTANVVEDVDAIRAALGEKTISWFGLSYGTEIGAMYAAKYPRRVRAMVLDGAMDHSRSSRRAIVDEAAAVEDDWHQFATWCAIAPECALRGQNVLAYYDALMADGEQGKVPSKHLGRPATADELASGAYNGLVVSSAWPLLSKALADARTDASTLTTASQFTREDFPAYLGVGCHDLPSPFTGPRDLKAAADQVKRVAPHSWRYSEFWTIATACTGWPVPPKNPPHPEHISGTAPILVVGGEHDPATPLVWARGLTSRIDNGTLLTYAAPGHSGTYNSGCARAAIAKYLVSGVTPAKGTICPA